MSDETGRSEGFNSDRFLRRLERERRLKEIEQTFQTIAEEAKQKQEDIYNNAFTKKGQEESFANSNVKGATLVRPKLENQSSSSRMLSRMAEMVTSNRAKQAQSPTFEMSPSGVAPFPEIGPIGVAKKGTGEYWNKNDGPGMGARLTNAKVQDTIMHSFFSIRKNSKMFACGSLLLLFIVILSVTLADVTRHPVEGVHLSEEGWAKLEMIRPILARQNVDQSKLSDRSSAHFTSLVWLASEAESAQTSILKVNERTLLERFVLVLFYHSTSNESEDWENKYNWLTEGLSVCEWQKVVCEKVKDDIDGEPMDVVTSLNLSGNKLSGTITDEISKLENLEVLRLSNNRLEGRVPSSIGNLKYLTTLDLGENRLTGEVPDSICDLRLEAKTLTKLVSDCGGSGSDIECSCCTNCSP